jgi:hypothetical protein
VRVVLERGGHELLKRDVNLDEWHARSRIIFRIPEYRMVKFDIDGSAVAFKGLGCRV